MRTELEFELLPGIPEIWLDFLNARLPLAPANRNMDFLAAHADAYRRQAANSEILLRIFAAAAEAGARYGTLLIVYGSREPSLF